MVYVSAAIKPFTPTDLRELLSKARTHNSSVGITGLLLYHKMSFFQILEGQADAVTLLFSHIERDPRHNRVMLLSRKEAGERNFGACASKMARLLAELQHCGTMPGGLDKTAAWQRKRMSRARCGRKWSGAIRMVSRKAIVLPAAIRCRFTLRRKPGH